MQRKKTISISIQSKENLLKCSHIEITLEVIRYSSKELVFQQVDCIQGSLIISHSSKSLPYTMFFY